MTEEKGERTTWGLAKVWLDGSKIGSSKYPIFSSGWTNNFGLCANHQLLFLFSSSVSRAGRKSISQPSQILGR